MTRSFNVMATIDGSKPLSYFVSRSYDAAEKHLSDGTRDVLRQMVSTRPAVLTVLEEPQIFENQLETYVQDALIAIGRVANDLNRSDLPEDEKNALAAAMLNSPVIKFAPTQPVIGDADRGARLIELALYMTVVMNSDFFQEETIWGMAYGSQTSRGPRRPIEVPTTGPAYPENYRDIKISGEGHATQARVKRGYVDYDQPGVVLRSRVDELHAGLFNEKPFFQGRSDKNELERAEALYGAIMAEFAVMF